MQYPVQIIVDNKDEILPKAIVVESLEAFPRSIAVSPTGIQGPQGVAGDGVAGNNDVGVIYLKNNATTTVIPTINARAVVAGTMETGTLYNFEKDATTNSLKYTGDGGRFHIVATFNFYSGPNDTCGFYIGKNVNPVSALDPNTNRISESEIYAIAVSQTKPASAAIQTVVDLSTGDRIFFIVQNKEAARNIKVEFLKFVAVTLTAEKGDVGATGPAGPAGLNTITTSTLTPLIGFISGDGTNITGATAGATAATPNTLVLRNANGGGVSFTESSRFINTLTVTHTANIGNADALVVSNVSGRGAFISSSDDIGAQITSVDGTGATIGSQNGTGAEISTTDGTYHAIFGTTGDDRSFVDNDGGSFGWFRGGFTGRIRAESDLSGDHIYTLPNRGGSVALTEDYTGGTATIDVLEATVETLNADDIIFENASVIREAGPVGLELECSIGYRWQWVAGRIIMRALNSNAIVRVIAIDGVVPSATNDDTEDYGIGTRWELLDGTIYECLDATTDNAIWNVRYSDPVPFAIFGYDPGDYVNENYRSTVNIDFLELDPLALEYAGLYNGFESYTLDSSPIVADPTNEPNYTAIFWHGSAWYLRLYDVASLSNKTYSINLYGSDIVPSFSDPESWYNVANYELGEIVYFTVPYTLGYPAAVSGQFYKNSSTGNYFVSSVADGDPVNPESVVTWHELVGADALGVGVKDTLKNATNSNGGIVTANLTTLTLADSFTLTTAHARAILRLTKASGTTTITLPTMDQGIQFDFTRIGAGELAFSGGTVTNGAAISRVQVGDTFKLVSRGSGSYDFIGYSSVNGGSRTDVFLANGTWTKPSGAKSIKYTLVGGGGGGGSGRRGLAGINRFAGAGGAGGAVLVGEANASYFASTESIIVGTGGLGGPNTANSTNGAVGGTGNQSSIGSGPKIRAQGGAGGGGGLTTPNAGPGSVANRSSIWGNNFANAGGGNGVTSAVAGVGGGGFVGPAGGGGGGGISSTNIAGTGGAGGFMGNIEYTLVSGGAAVANGAGQNGQPSFINYAGTGGAGGTPNSTTYAGNIGGNGGLYGAGGGGGSSALDGVAGNNTGGNGANGIVVITTYF